MRISDLSSDVCSSDLHIIDIVRRFPMADVAPQGFVSALRPLQPRLYSLASSLAAAPDEAHLTLAPVRYDLHGEARCGVASGLLADRAGPDTRSEEHTSELQSLMRNSYAVFCWKTKKKTKVYKRQTDSDSNTR